MFRLSASAAFLSAVLAVLSLATEIEAQTPANLCHTVITGEKIVATPGQRLAAGEQAQPPGIVGPSGFDWSDTQLGIVRSRDGANYLFFGSDGSCHANCGKFDERDGSITRTVGSFDDPLGADPPIETILPQSIQFQNNAIVYAGGGLVTRVPSGHPGAGNLLMVYGAARWTDLLGQNGNYGLTGLAKSYDDGVTWTDLGFIITANVPFIPGAPPNINEYDSGLGNLIPDPSGKFYYYYFPDKVFSGGRDNSPNTFFSVARVPIDDLLHAAFDQEGAGPLPSFEKYYAGDFDQPGLGGLSTSILNPESAAGDPVVIWSDYLQRYVVVFDDTGNIRYADSADGIHWPAAVTLRSVPQSIGSVLYAVPAGMEGYPNVIGRQFYIFYTFYQTPSATGGGWPTATIQRLTVECKEAESK